jgi:hypothetical protein
MVTSVQLFLSQSRVFPAVSSVRKSKGAVVARRNHGVVSVNAIVAQQVAAAEMN